MHENKKRNREEASLDVELDGFDCREQFHFSDVIDFSALEAAFQDDLLGGMDSLSRGLGMENMGNMGFLGDTAPLSTNTPTAGNNLPRSNSATEVRANVANGSSNANRAANPRGSMSSGGMKRSQAPVCLDIAHDVGKIFNDFNNSDCVYQSTADGWTEACTAWEYEELEDINLEHAPEKEESPSSPSSQSPRNQSFGHYQQPQQEQQLLNQQTPQQQLQVQNQEPPIPTQSRYPHPMYQPPQAQQFIPQQAHPPLQQNMRSYPYPNQPAHNIQIPQPQQQPYPQPSQPQNMKIKYDSNHYLNFGKQTDNNKANQIPPNHNLSQNPNGSIYVPFEANHVEAYDRANNWNRPGPVNPTAPTSIPVDPNSEIIFLKKKTAHLEAVVAQQDKKIEQILEQLNRISRKVKF
eukprot:TRINITY_DN27880_c0_g1_i1.p1 TRINITY_DN27880_c0_g1~~TRINITY_DN27880_c0_g1_i1.p1  ORF type:complete len:407 (+),score=69.68 TRINITY_DN27880_c0_g1_i1:157-1377(+)